MELFDIIKNRPMEYKSSLDECPFCESIKLNFNGTKTTLLGGRKGVNHEEHFYQCFDCSEQFILEEKALNSWITKQEVRALTQFELDNILLIEGYPTPTTKKVSIIIEGVASCFEHYVYQCIKCNGEVTRKYIDKKTQKITNLLSSNFKTGEKSYITTYTCDCCGHGGETEVDYYYPESKQKPIAAKKDYTFVAPQIDDMVIYTDDFENLIKTSLVDYSNEILEKSFNKE